jgi:hypothetical protein
VILAPKERKGSNWERWKASNGTTLVASCVGIFGSKLKRLNRHPVGRGCEIGYQRVIGRDLSPVEALSVFGDVLGASSGLAVP